LSINGGRVTLKATDATLREILAEWAKVGHTQIVNADRLTGASLALELNDVPERVALNILLRSISGYVAAPRAIPIEDGSAFDRILIMPTTAPPRAAVPPPPTFASSPAPFGQATQPQPVPVVPVMVDSQDAQPTPNPPRGPAFAQFPQPQVPRTPQEGAPPLMEQPTQQAPPPQQQPFSQPQPGMSIGVSVPGMVVPAPQQSDDQAPQPRN
jgi:hypothetical protein